MRKKWEEKKYLKFLLILKELSVNSYFVEFLEKIPGYVKFMKELIIK